MDAFRVFRFHLIPSHIRVGVQFDHDVPHQVLDKHRILVSPLRDRLFVLPLQQRKSSALAELSMMAMTSSIQIGLRESELDGHFAALVVRAVCADGF